MPAVQNLRQYGLSGFPQESPSGRPANNYIVVVPTSLSLGIALTVAITLAGCVSSSVDPISAGVLADQRREAVGPTTARPITIGDVDEQPWSLYLEVSNQVGLDFSGLAGAEAELRMTPISTESGVGTAYVLVHGGKAVGGWLDPGGEFGIGGVNSLRDHRP